MAGNILSGGQIMMDIAHLYSSHNITITLERVFEFEGFISQQPFLYQNNLYKFVSTSLEKQA